MSKPKYDVPDEIYDAVNAARISLDEIIPNASEGEIGVAIARINEVMEHVSGIAGVLHRSAEAEPVEFFTTYYATANVLKSIESDAA